MYYFKLEKILWATVWDTISALFLVYIALARQNTKIWLCLLLSQSSRFWPMSKECLHLVLTLPNYTKCLMPTKQSLAINKSKYFYFFLNPETVFCLAGWLPYPASSITDDDIYVHVFKNFTHKWAHGMKIWVFRSYQSHVLTRVSLTAFGIVDKENVNGLFSILGIWRAL